jgi:hypothetical protein
MTGMEEKGNACRIFVGKPAGKGPLNGHTLGWKDSIKKYPKLVG